MANQTDNFLCALLLSDLDDSVSLERTSLRRAGVSRVRSLREGCKALEFLEQQCNLEEGNKTAFAGQEHVDVVVCTDQLSDMSAGTFLRAFASLRNKVEQQYEAKLELLPPVLVISPNMLIQEDFLAQGAEGVLARPYTISSLARSIQDLRSAGAYTSSRFASADSFFSKLQKKAQQKLEKEIKTREPQISIFASPLLAQIEADEKVGAGADLQTADLWAREHPELAPLAERSALSERPELGIERTLKAVADLTSDILNRQDQKKRQAALPAVASSRNQPSPAVIKQPLAQDMTHEEENPLLFTRAGLKLMREGKSAGAEHLLRKALQYDNVDIEAALGLASICKKNGDTQGERRWINRAALISRETRQNERADMLFAHLPKDMAANPYLAEAGSLLLEEAYDEAAEAFVEAANHHKENNLEEHPLYAMVARACQFTECPEHTLSELCAAYSRIGRPHIASNLYRRLLNETQESTGYVPESFLARFPKLYEVVEVARFAMQSWRRVKATSQL
ncbi:MAG: hypothetical protein LBV76_05610 [Deltaproteobacteria bacterium]|jgi:DNA-binding NarL/FixJ family response regulator|nr:hypothetical protein [Deltaproteobacteria bacterium]